MSLTRESRPRLARKARLRWDRKASRHVLLYPERGLVLNETAAQIVLLCDGARSLAQIAGELAARYQRDPGGLEAELLFYLGSLEQRGLLELSPVEGGP